MGRKRKTNAHMPPRVYYKNGRWRYMVPPSEQGEWDKTWVTLGTTEREALANYAKMMSDKEEAGTAGELFTRYMRDVVPLKAPRTQQDNIKQIKYIRIAFEKMAIHAIKPMHIAQYRDIRSKKSTVQTNRELSLLSHIFNKALEWGVVDINPCLGVKRLVEHPRDRLPEPWEVEVLMNHASNLICAYIPLKIATGVRQGDLLKIMLSDIKHDGIHIKQGKTNKKQIIPLSNTIQAFIADIKSLNESGIESSHLFCDQYGQPITQRNFQYQWYKAMSRAMQSGKLQERFTEHDLRALHAHLADEQGIDAQQNLAHDDARTTRIYLRSKKATIISPVDINKE